LWESKGARNNRLASPVVYEGLLYAVTEQGVLETFDVASGAPVYQKRLSLRRGRTDPSLCVAGDVLFASTNDGATVAIKTGRELRVLWRARVDEGVRARASQGPWGFVRTPPLPFCLGDGP